MNTNVEPMRCPQCGSGDITYIKSYDADWKLVECEECEAKWSETWEFVEFEMVEGTNNGKHIVGSKMGKLERI